MTPSLETMLRSNALRAPEQEPRQDLHIHENATPNDTNAKEGSNKLLRSDMLLFHTKSFLIMMIVIIK
jgi:hypothetical protein